MTSFRLAMAGLLPIVALGVTGCLGGGDSGGGGRTARFGGGSKDKQTASATPRTPTAKELNATTPEASVQRELEKLKAQEKQQAKYVNEMRDALAKDSTAIQREENKLRDIRTQVEQFESAQQRYKQALAMDRQNGNGNNDYNGGMNARTAGYEAGSQPVNRAASFTSEYPPNSQPGGYQSAPQSNQPNYTQNDRNNYQNNHPGQPVRGEEVLYGGQPRSSLGGKSFSETPAPAVHRAPVSAPAHEDVVWDPPRELYSRNTSAPAARQATQVQANRNVPQNLPDPATLYRPVQTSAPMPQPAPVAAPAPSPMLAPPALPGPAAQKPADDEVFTPDIFLSGGR